MKLSIVATLYQSAPYITEFYQRASISAKQLAEDDYEIILVNDGSPDNSLDIAVRLADNDDHVVIVDLSRNFGHHKAMMTGLTYSKGELVFLIDTDLEEEPEWLKSFYQKLTDESVDVVFGVQEERKGGFLERVSGTLFYWVFNKLTGLPLPKNPVTARLMRRKYVNALTLHKEQEIFMAGLWLITGFNQHAFPVKKHNTSKSTYSFQKKLALFVNSITSFTNAPLVCIFYIGLLISTFAVVYILYLFFNWYFLGKTLSGWTSVMASIWILGGLIISFIGIVGIYLSKIFSETKLRPHTIVRKVYGVSKN